MGRAISVHSSGEVRRLAQRAKNAGQARRLLAIAAMLDGSTREEAARSGGMDRQTLGDWVIRFNEQGPEGLINILFAGCAGQAQRRTQGLFSPASSTRARRLLSMASCAGGPAT